jgi:hypothetical protein
MAEYLAPGTAETAGADIILADGASATVNLKPATGQGALPADAVADVQIKTSGGDYIGIPGARMNVLTPAQNIIGPGTFRVIRRASVGIAGVDKS